VVSGAGVWKRNSFLRKNPALSAGAFRRHYLQNHGPLAAAQAGFRKFTVRYVQNHVEDLPDGDVPAFDGVTMTTQVPRADYARGFFQEPDYANVRPDELYLFDMERTVSVLGEVVAGDGAPQAGEKAIVLTGESWQMTGELVAAMHVAVSRLDRAGASALGFRDAAFAHPFMVECWFRTAADRAALIADAADLFGGGAIALPVREFLIFGPEKPWPVRPA
jgi:hypothetical protein